MGLFDRIVKRFSYQAVIVYKQRLTEAAYHIRIQADHIKNVHFTPGYFLRVGVGIGNEDASFQEKIRSYSVWAIDTSKGTLDLVIATHSNGYGARWITTCRVKDCITFSWKTGNFILDESADHYLMIGDLSALSHLHIIARHLPKDKKLESIIYSQNVDELFNDINGSQPFDLYEMAQDAHKEVIKKLQVILPKMTGKSLVYIAGDSRVCIALSQYFRSELKWRANQIKVKPFWNPDKKGLE